MKIHIYAKSMNIKFWKSMYKKVHKKKSLHENQYFTEVLIILIDFQ